MTLDRVVIAAVIVVVAAVVGIAARRRRPDPPTQPSRHVPTQLDRRDFPRPEAPWLVAVFTSATCHACADVARKAAVLESDEVAVGEIEYPAMRSVHERYAIDAVPTLVVADAEGVVRAAFQGPVTATDLWAAVAEAREPGSSPEPHLGR